jgi:hypothetical protein
LEGGSGWGKEGVEVSWEEPVGSYEELVGYENCSYELHNTFHSPRDVDSAVRVDGDEGSGRTKGGRWM